MAASVKAQTLVSLREYVAALDVCAFSAGSLAEPAELVKYALEEAALTASDQAREVLTSLIPVLFFTGKLSLSAIKEGAALAAGRLADLTLDAPDAADHLAFSLAWLVLERVLPEEDVLAGGAAAGSGASSLNTRVEEYLTGSAPLPLYQLRRAYAEVVDVFLRSFDFGSLAHGVAEMHARHANPQLVRKLLQRAVSVPRAQQRWLADALVAAAGKLVSHTDVEAGVRAFLFEIAAIAREQDVPLAAAEAAGAAVIAHAAAAGVLSPASVSPSSAPHGAAASCLSLAGANFSAARAAAEGASASAESPAAASDAVISALWGGDLSIAAITEQADAVTARAVAAAAASAAAGDADEHLEETAAAAGALLAQPSHARILAACCFKAAHAAASADAPAVGAVSRWLIFLANTRRIAPADVAAGARAFCVRTSTLAAAEPAGALRLLEALCRCGVLPHAALAEIVREVEDSTEDEEEVGPHAAGPGTPLERGLVALRDSLPRVRAL